VARALVSAWQRSELSAAEFGRKHGVNGQRLAWWRWKLAAEPATPALVPVEVASPPSTTIAMPVFGDRVPGFGDRDQPDSVITCAVFGDRHGPRPAAGRPRRALLDLFPRRYSDKLMRCFMNIQMSSIASWTRPAMSGSRESVLRMGVILARSSCRWMRAI
jgi:hypothetical protein